MANNRFLTENVIEYSKMESDIMIDGINISGFTEMQFYNHFENRVSILPNLKKVNIFIGENNCGKSRLMRSILKQSLIMYTESNVRERYKDDYRRYKNNIKNYINDLQRCQNEDVKKIVKGIEISDSMEMFYSSEAIYSRLETIKSKLNVYDTQESRIANIINSLKNCIQTVKEYLSDNGNATSNRENIIYIPILRGIENFEIYFKNPNNFETIKMTANEYKAFENFKDNAKNVYLNKVSGVYGLSQNKIFTAEGLYDSITKKLLGDEKSRIFVSEFEKFISDNFYDGKNPDRELYNLGEGIKQLIVLFYKIYEQKDNNAIFLIEEPELNLHPGFQRKFIEITTKKFPQHQFFITTHSNHIIDLYNEQDNISVYKFRNSNQEKSKFYIDRVMPKDVSILDEIGAKCSSVFMSNCTIWVEGISDKIYISKYLELYFKSKNQVDKYKEDIHYSFIEYGGNNITHWSFIDDNDIDTINSSAIAHNIFIVCDNDDNKKIERKNKLKEVLGERVYILKSREIENIISKNVLENTIKQDNKIDEIKYKRISNYTEKNYAKPKIKMAKFIDDTFDLKKKYSGKYNTLKNKADFAKKAITNMNNYDDLTQEAKDLTEKIVKFIEESNK